MTALPITVCMTVRNESARISRCLDAVIPWVDEILIADTGSTDGTPQLLQHKYQITTVHIPLFESDCFTKSNARNQLIQRARNEWILTLDADEVIQIHAPKHLARLLSCADVAGYFGAWINDPGAASQFEDYKLFLFRRTLRMRGLVHEGVAVDIRMKGLSAQWQDCFTVVHQKAREARLTGQQFYRQRLHKAIRLQPHWIRYQWFLGYSYALTEDWTLAQEHLTAALFADSNLFPIEQMNAGATLAHICLMQGNKAQFNLILEHLNALLSQHRYDSEMHDHQACIAWIIGARAFSKGHNQAIPPLPQFAC